MKLTKVIAAALATATLAACSAPAPMMQMRGPQNFQRFNAPVRAMNQSGPKVFNTDMKPQSIPNQAIVKVRDAEAFQASLARTNVRVIDRFDIDSPVLLVESVGRSSEDLVSMFQNDVNVQIAQPNFYFDLKTQLRQANPRMQMQAQRFNRFSAPSTSAAAPNDPLFDQEWHMNHVKALQAWDHSRGNDDFIISVVDTGVDYNHPDLRGRVIKGADYTGESDGSDPIDSFGHGTHVAGIINAMANNGIGVAGVAPNVKVLAVKVLNAKGGGGLFAIAKGIHYSVKQGAKIVNLSLGGPAVKDMISAAVGWWSVRQGALLIAAAGNSSGPVGTPARIDDYYMAVGATNEADDLADFSCYGKELSVTAPGTAIMATTPTYKVPLNEFGYPMNYAALQGTSMATPLVAGVAALVWTKNPGMDYKQVRAQLERSSVDLGAPGKDNTFGVGRVDALAAVTMK